MTPSLTKRQVAVLVLAADGKTNPEIARELYLSVDSVCAALRELYRKLGARNRSHAVSLALREGVIR